MTNEDKIRFLNELAENRELLEIARKAIEDQAIEFRDARLSVIRGNGIVCREPNGEASNIIRFGPETAVRIGLKAIADKLLTTK